ncbi:MAG TPA: AAA family ATPase [Candidatus Binatia bacterium]|nr:AAA family ATPase [Candidatus Binatia bacterium]
MRIERLEIGGFGRFADVGWDLDPGLTVMLGQNEAGKTTLLNAVRAILFGFESSRDGRAWYPALAGGRRGGRLSLVTASGDRWSVERHGERGGAGSLAVRAPSGNQGGQETLDRLMHGADRDLFNAIFAFGLGELQDLATLGGEAVRGRIYGAAAGLGGTSAIDVERRLREEQEALFRPSGRLQPINQLFSRMDDLHARITELARQPEAFETAHRERAAARAAAAARRDEVQALRGRVLRLQKLLDAAPFASTLETLDVELAATDPALDELAPEAVSILESRLAALAEERARLAALDEQLTEIEVQLAGISIDERLAGAADEIRAVDADRRGHAGAADRMREAAAAEARHAAAVGEQLARAGSWDEPRLLALDDSIASIEATREHERRLEQAAEAAAEADRRHRAAADELAAREREGGPPAENDGDEADAIAALRQLNRLRERRRVAGGGPPVRLPGSLRRLPGVAALVGVLVALPFVGAFGLGLGLGAAAIGAVLGALVAAVLLLATRDEEPADASDEATLLARAGLAPGAADAEIAGREVELLEVRARRSLVRDEAGRLEARREEVARLGEAAAAGSAALTAAREAWDAWLSEHGMTPGASPEVARQVLAAAGIARRAAEERDEQRRILARLEEAGTELDRRASALLERLEVGERGSIDGRLASLVHRLERTVADRRVVQQAEARHAALVERRRPIEASVETLSAAVTEHLASHGCGDADALRALAAAAAERRALQQRMRETRARLGGVTGGPEAVDALRAELRDRDLSSVEAELATAAADAERLEDEERALLATAGELDARIRDLEAADELGTLRQELATLEGRAEALATEWAVRAIASRLLSETRSRYERERQPDVVRAATAHFERITGGRYARIVAPPGDGSVRVETESGEARLTDELSRGTAEQLYLALRFGLIEEFARQAEALPVVMDDILVNFDADRADRAAAAIRDLATRHQVLFFTCHAAMAKLLDPDGGRTVSLD